MSDAKELFYRLIEDYLKENSQRTLHSLSTKSGIGYSTIRNIASRKVVPDCDTGMRLAYATLGFEKACSFLSEAYPSLSQYFRRLKKHNVKEVSGNIEPSLFSFTDNMLLILIDGLREEATVGEVLNRLGLRVAGALQNLIDNEVVLEADGELKLSSNMTYFKGNTAGLNRIRHLVEAFNLSLISQKGSFHSCLTSGVNDEALVKLHEAYCSFEKTLEDLLFDPKNSGSNVVSAGFVSTFIGGKK
ncbi:MAG: hypothetical protein NTX25_24250 [Proteobacteria bacterium]|nr:hypothetical protein [Pseudomonadota bacterium]